MPNVDHVFIRHLLHAKIMFRTYGFCLRIRVRLRGLHSCYVFTPHTFAIAIGAESLGFDPAAAAIGLREFICYVMKAGVSDVLEGQLLAYLDSGLSLEQQWQV